MPSRRPAQLRVYQLAKECGIESQVLMSRMRDMGEYVISASSIVEPATADKLRVWATRK
jgi:translation initiation factor IF-2